MPNTPTSAVCALRSSTGSKDERQGTNLCASTRVCFSGEYLIPVGKWNPKDMHRRQFIQGVMAACTVSPDTHALAPFVTGPESPLSTVRSKDGTLIAVECAGAGPSLVIVHGGTGDRSRWTPLFHLFALGFRVFSVDRRVHGASGDSTHYSLQREAEDVAARRKSRPVTVVLFCHSFW